MLDPNHNAHGDYYLVDGDYTGSWNYIPPDLGIICWYYAKRRESLAHFSKLGFRTFAGAYYDGDTSTTRTAGWKRWTRRPTPTASCTPPGRASTNCWPISATWCRNGRGGRGGAPGRDQFMAGLSASVANRRWAGIVPPSRASPGYRRFAGDRQPSSCERWSLGRALPLGQIVAICRWFAR